jgi:hypothetical protein
VVVVTVVPVVGTVVVVVPVVVVPVVVVPVVVVAVVVVPVLVVEVEVELVADVVVEAVDVDDPELEPGLAPDDAGAAPYCASFPWAGPSTCGGTTFAGPGTNRTAVTAAAAPTAVRPPSAKLTRRPPDRRCSVRCRSRRSGGSAARRALRLLDGAARKLRVGQRRSTASSGPP